MKTLKQAKVGETVKVVKLTGQGEMCIRDRLKTVVV